jgi:hypothetical protein
MTRRATSRPAQAEGAVVRAQSQPQQPAVTARNRGFGALNHNETVVVRYGLNLSNHNETVVRRDGIFLGNHSETVVVRHGVILTHNETVLTGR